MEMKLTLEETKQGLTKMANDNISFREAHGVEGDNENYIVIMNALTYLS